MNESNDISIPASSQAENALSPVGDVLAKNAHLAQMIASAEKSEMIRGALLEGEDRQFINEAQAQALLTEIRDMQRQLLVFFKPLLTVDEAAELLGVKPKRFTNILYEEKSIYGKFPEFVCDAGGVMQRRILRDALLEWVKRRKPLGGRRRHDRKTVV